MIPNARHTPARPRSLTPDPQSRLFPCSLQPLPLCSRPTRCGKWDRTASSPALGLHLLSRWASPHLSKCPWPFVIELGALSAPCPTAPRFLAMLLSKALRILCGQTINYKPRVFGDKGREVREGRCLAALRPEGALDLSQELLASWFLCPQRLLSHFFDELACK